MKYIGNIYDSRWKVDCYKRIGKTTIYRYVLKNIFNGRTIEIHPNTMRKIDEGKSSVSFVIRYKLDHNMLEDYEKNRADKIAKTKNLRRKFYA